MRTLCWIAIFALAPVRPAAAQNSLREFAGRWDLTVTSGESVFPSWLEVAENDGRPQVRAQEREGAVHPVPAAQVLEMMDRHELVDAKSMLTVLLAQRRGLL